MAKVIQWSHQWLSLDEYNGFNMMSGDFKAPENEDTGEFYTRVQNYSTFIIDLAINRKISKLTEFSDADKLQVSKQGFTKLTADQKRGLKLSTAILIDYIVQNELFGISRDAVSTDTGGASFTQSAWKPKNTRELLSETPIVEILTAVDLWPDPTLSADVRQIKDKVVQHIDSIFKDNVRVSSVNWQEVLTLKTKVGELESAGSDKVATSTYNTKVSQLEAKDTSQDATITSNTNSINTFKSQQATKNTQLTNLYNQLLAKYNDISTYNEADESTDAQTIAIKVNDRLDSPSEWLEGLHRVVLKSNKTYSASTTIAFKVYKDGENISTATAQFSKNVEVLDQKTNQVKTSGRLTKGKSYIAQYNSTTDKMTLVLDQENTTAVITALTTRVSALETKTSTITRDASANTLTTTDKIKSSGGFEATGSGNMVVGGKSLYDYALEVEELAENHPLIDQIKTRIGYTELSKSANEMFAVMEDPNTNWKKTFITFNTSTRKFSINPTNPIILYLKAVNSAVALNRHKEIPYTISAPQSSGSETMWLVLRYNPSVKIKKWAWQRVSNLSGDRPSIGNNEIPIFKYTISSSGAVVVDKVYDDARLALINDRNNTEQVINNHNKISIEEQKLLELTREISHLPKPNLEELSFIDIGSPTFDISKTSKENGINALTKLFNIIADKQRANASSSSSPFYKKHNFKIKLVNDDGSAISNLSSLKAIVEALHPNDYDAKFIEFRNVRLNSAFITIEHIFTGGSSEHDYNYICYVAGRTEPSSSSPNVWRREVYVKSVADLMSGSSSASGQPSSTDFIRLPKVETAPLGLSINPQLFDQPLQAVSTPVVYTLNAQQIAQLRKVLPLNTAKFRITDKSHFRLQFEASVGDVVDRATIHNGFISPLAVFLPSNGYTKTPAVSYDGSNKEVIAVKVNNFFENSNDTTNPPSISIYMTNAQRTKFKGTFFDIVIGKVYKNKFITIGKAKDGEDAKFRQLTSSNKIYQAGYIYLYNNEYKGALTNGTDGISDWNDKTKFKALGGSGGGSTPTGVSKKEELVLMVNGALDFTATQKTQFRNFVNKKPDSTTTYVFTATMKNPSNNQVLTLERFFYNPNSANADMEISGNYGYVELQNIWTGTPKLAGHSYQFSRVNLLKVEKYTQ